MNACVQEAAVDKESSAQTREHKLRELDEVLAAVDVHVRRLLAEAAALAEEREKVYITDTISISRSNTVEHMLVRSSSAWKVVG
jgi:uncharacterized membrane protein